MSLSTRDAQHIDFSAKTAQGNIKIAATGFAQGASRHIVLELTDKNNSTSTTTVTSNSSAKSILINYQSNGQPIEVLLSGVDSQETGNISVRKGKSAPELFSISVPTLIKTKSLVEAVQDGRGGLLKELIGSQDLKAATDEYGTLLQEHPDFQIFVEKTEPAGGAALLAWWCWVIFLTPGLSITGLLFKTCTGWQHGI